jgi:hypothetical protein
MLNTCRARFRGVHGTKTITMPFLSPWTVSFSLSPGRMPHSRLIKSDDVEPGVRQWGGGYSTGASVAS